MEQEQVLLTQTVTIQPVVTGDVLNGGLTGSKPNYMVDTHSTNRWLVLDQSETIDTVKRDVASSGMQTSLAEGL